MCAAGGEEDAPRRNTQGRHGAEAGERADGRRACRDTGDCIRPAAGTRRQTGECAGRGGPRAARHRDHQPYARRHAEGFGGGRPDLGRHQGRPRRGVDLRHRHVWRGRGARVVVEQRGRPADQPVAVWHQLNVTLGAGVVAEGVVQRVMTLERRRSGLEIECVLHRPAEHLARALAQTRCRGRPGSGPRCRTGAGWSARPSGRPAVRRTPRTGLRRSRAAPFRCARPAGRAAPPSARAGVRQDGAPRGPIACW